MSVCVCFLYWWWSYFPPCINVFERFLTFYIFEIFPPLFDLFNIPPQIPMLMIHVIIIGCLQLFRIVTYEAQTCNNFLQCKMYAILRNLQNLKPHPSAIRKRSIVSIHNFIRSYTIILPDLPGTCSPKRWRGWKASIWWSRGPRAACVVFIPSLVSGS